MALPQVIEHTPVQERKAVAIFASDGVVVVRDWHKRKDRSAIGRWPQPQLPTEWLHVEPDGEERVSFAVDSEGDGRLIGRITLREWRAGTAEMGIYLHPDYYNQGLGTRAIKLFRSLMPALQLVELRLKVAAVNHRACRAYEKAGFYVYGMEWKDEPKPVIYQLMKVKTCYTQLSNLS